MHCTTLHSLAVVIALAGLSFFGPAMAAESDRKAEPAKKADKPATKSSTLLSLIEAVAGRSAPAKSTPQKQAEDKGSHKQTATLSVKSRDGQTNLQTMCVDGEGRILALVAPPRSYGASKSNGFGEVHVLSPEGKKLNEWKVKFHAHSINTGPDGVIFVAGDGWLARFDKDGKPLAEIELPHIKEMLANKEALRKEAEQQLKQQRESFKRSIDQIKQQKEKIEAIAADKRTAQQKRQLQQYESILRSYAETEKYYASLTVESIMASKVSRMKIINAIAVSKKDVFITCGDIKGYGYAVWRMDHDFKNPTKVLGDLRGCCGQMDIQCCGEDLLVAQNCDYQFGRYDRGGKKIGSWGKSGTDLAGFGGCCNPMNVTTCKGEVYTAESEGIIKRFSDKGEFLGAVGHAPLTGGCKNVAVGVSPDGSRVYFADQPGSRIIVLTRKTTPASE